MENIVFKIQFRPIVDKEGKVKYRKLRILKISGKSEEVLSKGKLLHFIDAQFERIEKYIEQNQRIVIELPLDFLLSKTLIEPLNLSRLNFLLTDPISKFTNKHAFHFRKLVNRYTDNGLEISVYISTFGKYRFQLAPIKFSFFCQTSNEENKLKPVCFYDVDDEKTFESIKSKGELFCGKLFGDYTTVLEINALTYLQTTLARALEILDSEEVAINELEKSIKADPQLAVSLVKYANSPLIAPPSPIKDLKHAIIYLGLTRLKQFLMALMISQMASVDKEFEEIALRISAYGFLMENLGSSLKKYSQCQLFLAGIVLGAQKIFKKPIGQILEMVSPPKHCIPPLEDENIQQIFSQIKETDIEKTVLELKKLLGTTER